MIFLVLAVAIGTQIFLTVKKVNPFLSLLLVSILSGLLLEMEPKAILIAFEKGAGNTLSNLILILCLGAVFGKILESSGAADQITHSILRSFGIKHIQWGILLTGFLVGIPLYYNAGFIILVPFVFMIAANSGVSLLFIAIPMAASLSVTHCFLPPHPGPVMLVNAFQADVGKTLWYGIIIAIPAVIVAGPFMGKIWRHHKKGTEINSLNKVSYLNPPFLYSSFIIAFVPVLLILISVLTPIFLEKNNFLYKMIMFLGDSTVAMLLAVFLAIYFLGLRQGKKMVEIMQWAHEGISGIAMIVLIITAGGIFKQVLIDSGTATYIANRSLEWHMPPLVFGWLVTAVLRVSMGSATVAGLTAAGILSPIVSTHLVSPELMVLAVGAGSVFGSHINDTGFWMFKEFFKLSLKETFLSWTMMEIVISMVGLIGVLLLDVFIR